MYSDHGCLIRRTGYIKWTFCNELKAFATYRANNVAPRGSPQPAYSTLPGEKRQHQLVQSRQDLNVQAVEIEFLLLSFKFRLKKIHYGVINGPAPATTSVTCFASTPQAYCPARISRFRPALRLCLWFQRPALPEHGSTPQVYGAYAEFQALIDSCSSGRSQAGNIHS